MKNTRSLFRKHSFSLFPLLSAIFLSLALSACYVDDGWYPEPPYGWNDTFYDARLDGYWQLVQINGANIGGYDTNYLYFNGDGRGFYYYYQNRRQYWENTAYWCQDSNNGATDYQINLQYETGSPSTMNYWFTDGGRSLWMQWRTGSGLQTYLYRRIPAAPW